MSVRSVLAVIFLVGVTLAQQAGYGVNFEAPPVHPIRLSPSGERLFVADTDTHHLEVWSLADRDRPVLVDRIPVGACPVSVTPRTDDEVWVACWLSDCVSVVSVSAGREIAVLRVKDEPTDVVFASGRAFVAASASDAVVVFDATTRVELGTVAIPAKDPRALATDPAGTKVYALSLRSGNRTTVIPAAQAPAPPAPTNGALPPAPQQGIIGVAGDPAFPQIGWTLPDDDLFEINAATMTVSRTAKSVGTINTNMAVHPVTGEIFVANTEAKNRTRFEPAIRGHAIDSRITRVTLGTTTSVVPVDLNPGMVYTPLPHLPSIATALAEPFDVAIDAAAGLVYVAGFGSDRIGILDLSGNVVARLESFPTIAQNWNPAMKRGPRGLALHPIAQRLYVANTLSRSVSVYDTASRLFVGEFSLGGVDPLSPSVRVGRRYFYDARLSGNGSMSCASCHVDAEIDGLAWDLGDPSGSMVPVPANLATFAAPQHPMKGPMTTQTMRGLGSGLAAGDPLHWRGDRTTFDTFNASFAELLGGAPLNPAQLADFTAFATTIAFPPNPNQTLARGFATTPIGASASVGRSTFLNQTFTTGGVARTCATCHVNSDGGAAMIVPGPTLGNIQAYNPPQLRNLYRRTGFNALQGPQRNGTGFSFDGSTPGLTAFLNLSFFASYPASLKDDVVAFLMAFDTGTAPGVGYRVALDAATIATSTVTAELSTLRTRAAALDLDLVASTRVGAERVDWLWNPGTATWTPDVSTRGVMTHTAFVAAVAAGTMNGSVMGVAPGTGVRFALDADLDGRLDGDMLAVPYGTGTAGALGTPAIAGNGEVRAGNMGFAVVAARAAPFADGWLVAGTATASVPLFGVTLLVDVVAAAPVLVPARADAHGTWAFPVPIGAFAGARAYAQIVWADASAPSGISATAGLDVLVRP